MGSTRPSPEQKVYVYVPFSLPLSQGQISAGRNLGRKVGQTLQNLPDLSNTI